MICGLVTVVSLNMSVSNPDSASDCSGLDEHGITGLRLCVVLSWRCHISAQHALLPSAGNGLPPGGHSVVLIEKL